ncbi:MAG: ATP-binding cassette domain-containing protein [Candidatus Marinimicrobia bacterium]|nr:ATP-binding cassette domain-containing protein [Candidatus Neomarinimicrobiota bacterium]
MIELKNVTKYYKTTKQHKKEKNDRISGKYFKGVDDISFTCQPGRVFGLLGPNGAGKTTTLRMISTILKPTSGTISVLGFDTTRQASEVRNHLGFLTGNTGLYDRLTAEEMVKYYADLYGMDKATYRQRRDKLFHLLGMEEFANRRNGKLSDGMKQKVSIARTMIHDPQVIVFDEPTEGLDVMTSRSIINLIRLCRDEGKTVIFSTHRMGEVGQLCDDLAIIHNGRLFYNGTYKDFLSGMKTETLEDEFIRLTGEEA